MVEYMRGCHATVKMNAIVHANSMILLGDLARRQEKGSIHVPPAPLRKHVAAFWGWVTLNVVLSADADMHRGCYLPTVSHATRPYHARCRCSPGGGPGGGGCAGVLLSGTSGDTSAALQGVKSGEAGLVKGLLRPMYCPMHCPENGECGPRLCRTVCNSQTRTASRLPSPLYTTAHHHCSNCTNRSWNQHYAPGRCCQRC